MEAGQGKGKIEVSKRNRHVQRYFSLDIQSIICPIAKNDLLSYAKAKPVVRRVRKIKYLVKGAVS